MKLLHLWTCTTGQSHRAQSKQRRTTVPHRTTTPSPWHWDSTTPPLLNPLTLDWWSSSKWGEENAQVYIATSIRCAQVELNFGCWPQRKNKYYWPQWHMDSSADRQNASFTIRFLQACQCHCSRCKLRSSLHFPQQSGNQQFSWTHGDRIYKKNCPHPWHNTGTVIKGTDPEFFWWKERSNFRAYKYILKSRCLQAQHSNDCHCNCLRTQMEHSQYHHIHHLVGSLSHKPYSWSL